MKKSILISIIPILSIFIFIAAQSPAPVVITSADDVELDWPEEVVTLLQNSCFDCHSSDGGNIKAKGALNFSKWAGYKLTKKINKLNGIIEEVAEKKMPPKKYIANKPNTELSEDEIKTIVDWANAEADKLIEEE